MLSPAALLAPPDGIGRLAVSLFAPETAAEVTARVRAYLAVAYADPRIAALPESDRDRAAAAYAYAEAYDAKADLVHDDDASAEVEGQGSRTTAPDQRAYWRARASEYRTELAGILASTTTGTVSAYAPARFLQVRSRR